MPHWYRGKMLGRVGGRGWLRRDAAVPPRALRRGPPARARALRRGRPRAPAVQPARCARSCCAPATTTPSSRLARFETGACARRAGARDRARRHAPGAAPRVAARQRADARCASSAAATARSGCPPTERAARRRSPRPTARSPATLRRAAVDVCLHNVEDGSRVPAAGPHRRCSSTRPRRPGRVRPARHHASRSPRPPPPPAARSRPGRWEVRADVTIAGFSRHAAAGAAARASRCSSPPTRPGRIVVGRHGAAAPARRGARLPPAAAAPVVADAQADAGNSRRSRAGADRGRGRCRTARRRSRIPAPRGVPWSRRSRSTGQTREASTASGRARRGARARRRARPAGPARRICSRSAS